MLSFADRDGIQASNYGGALTALSFEAQRKQLVTVL
jgi:hypothetical protein